MPVSSIKIGIDLDPIKPIYGCTTFACDITSEKCRSLIKKEIKHFKADVVLNDGAPNMGGSWTKDAFLQVYYKILKLE
jgi:AdoMet-dependent rRNA methyltransferase SPB1